MNQPSDPLDLLFVGARRASAQAVPAGAPLGFTSRVLARWRQAEQRDWTLWLLPRAIGMAAACATLLMLNGVFSGPSGDEQELGSLVMNAALEEHP